MENFALVFLCCCLELGTEGRVSAMTSAGDGIARVWKEVPWDVVRRLGSRLCFYGNSPSYCLSYPRCPGDWMTTLSASSTSTISTQPKLQLHHSPAQSTFHSQTKPRHSILCPPPKPLLFPRPSARSTPLAAPPSPNAPVRCQTKHRSPGL
jgi:hypothetical protein